MDTHSAQALIRFGLGRRGDEPAPDDPPAWLATQLDGRDPALAEPVTRTTDALAVWREQRKMPKAAAQPDRLHDFWVADSGAAMRRLATTDQPFRERLVWFWTNHFTVSVRKPDLRGFVLSYVHEAIRPHVTGRFVDMLQAVMRHPVMLWYLENLESIGPDSPVGLRTHRGINENLARECLELHTLSPAAGYTQHDVTEFAKILTGWSIAFPGMPQGFVFRENSHQPGGKTVMGMTFPPGEAGGVEALAWLGNHPMTFRHIAAKLVRHFIADDPAPADVKRLAGVLRDTRGDLKAAALELTRMNTAWQPLTKVRAPADYVVAAVRALDPPEQARPDMVALMNALGQPLLAAPLPNGWPDTAAAWADGEMLLRRADWALGIAGKRPDLDPVAIAQTSLGPLLGPDTLSAVRHATSRREAMALLLASPEFQRR
jgi:uncharacterized protein (DUF1800 family)